MPALISAEEAYRIWSASYDDDANPLLALEMRLLHPRLGPLAGRRFLDAATGTGRWMRHASLQGASVLGCDLSPSMLSVASRAATCRGRIVRGDIRRIPFSDRSADLAMCSFALGYVADPRAVLCELARVARRIIVSDLHPAALDAGWTRSFRARGQVYAIENFHHAASEAPPGLTPEWSVDGFFGEPERAIFESAGKGTAFDAAAAIPAIRAVCWS